MSYTADVDDRHAANTTDAQVVKKLCLSVLPSKHGLPSFDVDSLAALAYCKFGYAQLEIKYNGFTRFGYISNKEPVPALTDGINCVQAVDEIFELLRSAKFGADFHLSQKETADAVAFIALMESRLRPAVLHTYWLEEGNYEALTREAYALAFPLPAAIFQPRWRRIEALNYVDTLFGCGVNAMSPADVEKKIYSDALCCLNDLSDKLGSQRYLFGNEPTAADAVMFGYLAPITHIPFPRSRLKAHLEGYTNLCNTVNLIKRKYFPSTMKTDYERPQQEARADLIAEDKEFPHQTRNTFIAVVFGLTVMVTYILLRGVISVTIEDDMD